jgi:hypothetical protein
VQRSLEVSKQAEERARLKALADRHASELLELEKAQAQEYAGAHISDMHTFCEPVVHCMFPALTQHFLLLTPPRALLHLTS